MGQVVDIEIDVFSGRPNPKVQIRGDDAKRLIDLLARKRSHLNRKFADGNLGFRGFLLRVGSSPRETYRVVGDTLIKGTEILYDPKKLVQSYVVSVLPTDFQVMVRPLLTSGSAN